MQLVGGDRTESRRGTHLSSGQRRGQNHLWVQGHYSMLRRGEGPEKLGKAQCKSQCDTLLWPSRFLYCTKPELETCLAYKVMSPDIQGPV